MPNNAVDTSTSRAARSAGSRRAEARPSDRDAGAGRDRILAAALGVFAERGFDGATTASIARRAGVTQPLVHYHFDSKDELWRAAIGRVVEQIRPTFGEGPDDLADLDPVARLKVLVRRLVHFSAAFPEFGRILAFEAASGGDRLDWLLAQTGAAQSQYFHDVFEVGAAEGWVKALPAEHVATCLGAAAAYAFIAKEMMHKVYGIDVTDPAVVERHADTVVEIFFHGVLAGPSLVPASSASAAVTPRRRTRRSATSVASASGAPTSGADRG